MLKIVQAPEEVLSTKAKIVKEIDKQIKLLLKDMEESLAAAKDPEGVGLAAPQVGKSLQIFLIKQSPKSPLLTFINPKIEGFFEHEHENEQTESAKKHKKSRREKGVQLEGCLSLKDVWGVVTRNHGVELSYMDEHGKHHREKFHGFLATIIQHEFDHLQGILFPKRVLEQKNKLYHSSKNAQGETEFEEISL
ncbi:MAG TPA: peptide deformylase [Patescibacteria group bacterium]|nr:peptide deformylase [Patescibacteria group bacterium]